MAADERWYFTKEQLDGTASRKCGVDADKELSYRQQAANFIQDMGQRLPVNQLCINTAIVYMHRFYMFHSFTKFHRNAISACALFLAAKVEEQPRKLEHVIKVAHICLQVEGPLDTKSEAYLEQAQQLVMNENTMLQTLGFDVAIDHPHTHIVKCCQLVRASKDLAQTSYFMATNSLHLTTMCLQCKPTVVACVCIHLACKWASWEIPHSSEGHDWFWYVEKYITLELLEELTSEFLAILDKCPSRLKRKIVTASKEIAAAERKGRGEANASSSGSFSSLPALTDKSRSPLPSLKQERSERVNRLDRIQKLECFQQAENSDRLQKTSRTDNKLDRNERLERLAEKKEKHEKEKRDRTIQKEKLEKVTKSEKTDCTNRTEHIHEKSSELLESKPAVNNNAGNSHSGLLANPHVDAITMQNPVRLSGHPSSVVDPKSSAALDGNGTQTIVNKKHRHNLIKASSTKEHRDHKDKRETEYSDKEYQSLSTSAHTIQAETPPPPPQPQIIARQERIRHRKEENHSVKTSETTPSNSHFDARGASITPVGHGLEKPREKSSVSNSGGQKIHLGELKRSKHNSPKISDRNFISQHAKAGEIVVSDDRATTIMPPSNETKATKALKAEVAATYITKLEPLSPLPRVTQQVYRDKQNKDNQSYQNQNFKNLEQNSALPSGPMVSHALHGHSPIVDVPVGPEKINIPVERHERHDRKEKHKHKGRDKERKEKHDTFVQPQQEVCALPSASQSDSTGYNQRIKLTIPKVRLNSSNIDVSEKTVSPPKDARIKLKIPKERLAPTIIKKNNTGDIKLKIKIPKEAVLMAPSKKSETRKRDRDASPKDLNCKSNSPRSPKVARIETRSSKKDDNSAMSHLSLPLASNSSSVGSVHFHHDAILNANGSNAMGAGNTSYSNFSRKGGSKVNDTFKNKSSHFLEAYQQVSAGPYPYNQYYQCRPSMSNYYPHVPPTDFLPFFNQPFHQGPPLPPPPPDHGGPPLPRDPPPPTPPPPPE